MAYVDNAFYVDFGDGSTTGYYAATKWAALTTYDCGTLRRQLAAPAVGSERMFIVVVGHVASSGSEPTWVLTRGAKTTDTTITWMECTGVAGINGDITNTPTWTTVKNTSVSLGQVIKNVAGTILLICTTAGTAGNGAEPSWAAYTTAGATTVDNGATWTNIGVVGNFTGWQAPHARLTNAWGTNWAGAGVPIYVASEHAETQSTGLTITPTGTAPAVSPVLCVAKTPVPPTSVTTGASITTTGNSNITFTGFGYFDGVNFSAGSGAVAAFLKVNTSAVELRNCTLAAPGTSAGVKLAFGNNATTSGCVKLFNTILQFGNTGDGVAMQSCFLEWDGGSLAGSVPTTLFQSSSNLPGSAVIEGVDLSTISGTIVGNFAAAQTFIIKDCKLNASATIAAAQSDQGRVRVDLVRSDSGATNYRNERRHYAGSHTTETTIIRTGGASDGVTGVSWKIVTVNSQWTSPFNCIPIAIWNDTTGSSVTVTIYGVWGGGAVPNNDDIWIEAEYLGSSSTPISSYVNSTKASYLATNAALSSDSSAWGGSTTKFKMSVTFTPQMKGYIYVTVRAAKASSTFYIDPLVVLS